MNCQFTLASPKSKLTNENQNGILWVLERVSKSKTFKSISSISLVNMSEKAFIIDVIPTSSGWGWAKSLSNKICKELDLYELKDKNFLFHVIEV